LTLFGWRAIQEKSGVTKLRRIKLNVISITKSGRMEREEKRDENANEMLFGKREANWSLGKT
jgi:hypothetical protein